MTNTLSPIEEMARNCYGYGRWDAPYWFIGLEEGMSGTLADRIEAWKHLGEAGLSDCRLFHERIKDPQWHQKAELQRTWQPLILLLMTFLERNSDKESLREYQVRHWGCTSYADETCLIELFGLPAKDLLAGAAQRAEHFTFKQVEGIRQKRIEYIRAKMENHRETLKLVVMYGCNDDEMQRHDTYSPLRNERQSSSSSAIGMLSPQYMILFVTPYTSESRRSDRLGTAAGLPANVTIPGSLVLTDRND